MTTEPTTGAPAPRTAIDAFNADAARIEATPAGLAFMAAGFRMAHQAGGIGCWQREAGGGAIILISDLEGCSGELSPGGGDAYLVGLYDAEMMPLCEAVEAGQHTPGAIAAAARLAAAYAPMTPPDADADADADEWDRTTVRVFPMVADADGSKLADGIDPTSYDVEVHRYMPGGEIDVAVEIEGLPADGIEADKIADQLLAMYPGAALDAFE